MFKTTILLLTIALAGSVWSTIDGLEQARSLGHGTLARLLHSPDHLVAVRAALAIGRSKRPEGAALLLRRVSDRDTAMRAVSVFGLGLIATRETAPAVLSALQDTDETVQAAALDAVDRLETARVFTPAQEQRAQTQTAVLLSAAAPQIRGRAATTLESFEAGRYGSAAMRALVERYRIESDGSVRSHVMWSLFRGYAKQAPLTALRQGLRDRDEIVRIEAVRALGRRGDATQIATLQPLTNDPSWRVQEQTYESSIALRHGAPTQHLTAMRRGIHVPAPQPDPFARLRPLPRTRKPAKLTAPSANAILSQAKLDPENLALFTGPAKGPHPRVRLETSKGNITIELYPEWAPLTVENFLNLANAGYYDGNPWFRIVPDFVVQSGDPSATAPGPGYTTVAEENPIEEDSYIFAMGLNYTNPPNAHAERDSAGSEFYITLSPQYHLNRDFSVFGRVIGGFDVLGRLIESDKIVRVDRLPDAQ